MPIVHPGDVVEVRGLGVRFEFRMTAGASEGEVCEFDMVGRPRGLLLRAHAHPAQHERLEVISGALRVDDGLLYPGDVRELAPGAAHRLLPAGEGPLRVRVALRPAGRTEALLERLATLELNRFGYPGAHAAAELVRDFGEEARSAHLPLRIQQAVARAVLREYAFADEWDVDAAPEAVWDTLADGRTYPQWWRPVYLDVEAEAGPPAVGHVTLQHFTGRLPYHLHTRTRTVRLERPRLIEGETDGDLRGRGVWTLTPLPGDAGTHIRFDWRVHADRPLLRALSPVLRPLLRWNHAWAIARARDGLEPYLKGTVPFT